jgi:hypothetical protein
LFQRGQGLTALAALADWEFGTIEVKNGRGDLAGETNDVQRSAHFARGWVYMHLGSCSSRSQSTCKKAQSE